MNEQHNINGEHNRQATEQVECFLATTFQRCPVEQKVLIALFCALNSATTLTKDFELVNRLWNEMRFNGCGPLVGQSEEVNWLKGVCDGILLLADYS